MHIASTLSGSSRPLDKGRARRLLVLTVSLPFTGIRLFSVTLRLPLSWLLQPKLATILPSGAELTHTKPHTQLDLKMAFLSNSLSQLRIECPNHCEKPATVTFFYRCVHCVLWYISMYILIVD